MEIKKLGKSAILYTIGSVCVRVVGFVLLPFYTHYLSKSEYGIIELIELIIAVSTILVGLGSIGEAMIRIYHDFESTEEQNSVISTSLISAILIAFIVAGIGWLLSPFLTLHLLGDQKYSKLLCLAFISIVLGVNQELCLIYLRVKDEAVIFVAYSVASTLLLASFNIYFIGIQHIGIWGYVYSKLIVFSLGTSYLLVLVYKNVGFKWSSLIFKKLLKFGSPLIMSSLAFFIMHFADRFFLAAFSLEEVGIYSIGYKFGFLITFLVGEPFGRVWNARIFGFTKEKYWKIKFADVFSYLFFLLVLVFSILSFFSKDIIQIMVARSFSDTAIVIPFIALAYLLRECGDFFKQILFIKQRSMIVAIIATICALVNLSINYILILHYSLGMFGAMYSTLVTWMIYCFALYFFSQRDYNLPYRKLKSTLVLTISIIIAFISFTLQFSNLFVSIMVNFCLFFVLLLIIWWIGLFTKDEKNALIKMIPLMKHIVSL